MSPSKPSIADCIKTLLDQLGLESVHVAACMSGDWGEFVSTSQDRIRSLIVVAPHLNKGIPDRLETFAPPALVITGDQGAPAQRARDLVGRFRQGTLHELRDYSSPIWADTIADHLPEVAESICSFLERVDRDDRCPLHRCQRETVRSKASAIECAGMAHLCCCCRCRWRHRNGPR